MRSSELLIDNEIRLDSSSSSKFGGGEPQARVPEDFSIVGFDDIDLSDIIHPPLTTLRLSRQELAQAFYDSLSLFGKDPHVLGKQLSVSTALVIRSSTGAPRSR